MITGCSGTELDLSSYVPRQKKLRVWGFDDKSRDVLLAATTRTPPLRAVIVRASPAAEIKGLLILQATVDELDEIYTHGPSRRYGRGHPAWRRRRKGVL